MRVGRVVLLFACQGYTSSIGDQLNFTLSSCLLVFALAFSSILDKKRGSPEDTTGDLQAGLPKG
jgi:hypothetical protein